jgi:hypothetical protein
MAQFDEDVVVRGNFEVKRLRPPNAPNFWRINGKVKFHEDLEVLGFVNAKTQISTPHIDVEGTVTTTHVSATGNISALGNVNAGNMNVAGDILLQNADCAEDFNIADGIFVEPGSVMVLGDDGALSPCNSAYDKRVAGVISGAGGYKPGIVLDRQQTESLQVNYKRLPIALMGKVFCRVDAQHAAIEVGDLLTTSPTLGHAMKATDRENAFGSVIGKALRPFLDGRGLIPVLIALQ